MRTESIDEMRRKYIGKQITLIRMNDPYPVPDGTKGIVTHIDDEAQIHVKWDTGSTLAVIPDEDEYTIDE